MQRRASDTGPSRDLSEDKLILTEEKHDEIEEASLEQKKRVCCCCCKKRFAVKDLRHALADFNEQEEVDRNLAKLNTGKSLVHHTVEQGDLKELKAYHERKDFSNRPTMEELRKKSRVKTTPPDLNKLAVKRYATAPNTKKFAAVGSVASDTLISLTLKANLAKKRASLSSDISETDLTNRVLESFAVKPEERDKGLNIRRKTDPDALQSTFTGRFFAFIKGSTSSSQPGSRRGSSTFEDAQTKTSPKKGSSSKSDSSLGPTNSGDKMNTGKSKSSASPTYKTPKGSSDSSFKSTSSRGTSRATSMTTVRSTQRVSISAAPPKPRTDSRRGSRYKRSSITSVDVIRARLLHRFKINWGTVSKQCENWLTNDKKHKFSAKDRKTMERWFVIIYTNNIDEREEFLKFSTLYIKQTLWLYQVPYKEKDISVKEEYASELKTRLGKNGQETPMVFVHGSKLGNGEAIFYLHSEKKMPQAFKKYIIRSKKKYDAWYYKDFHQNQTVEMHINAPLSMYPSLEAVSQGMKAKLDGNSKSDIQQGKEYVKSSKSKWRDLSSRQYTDTDWYKYAVLQAHVRGVFKYMDRIFWSCFFPEKSHLYNRLPWKMMEADVKGLKTDKKRRRLGSLTPRRSASLTSVSSSKSPTKSPTKQRSSSSIKSQTSLTKQTSVSSGV